MRISYTLPRGAVWYEIALFPRGRTAPLPVEQELPAGQLLSRPAYTRPVPPCRGAIAAVRAGRDPHIGAGDLDVLHDHGPRADHAVPAYADPILHRRPHADPGPPPDLHGSGQLGSYRYMYEILDLIVMLDGRIGIDDAVSPDLCAGIDHGIRHDDAPLPYRGMDRGYRRGGMYGSVPSHALHRAGDPFARARIPDRYDETAVQELAVLRVPSQNRPSHEVVYPVVSRDEADQVVPRAQDDVRNDLCMSSCANDDDILHQEGPCRKPCIPRDRTAFLSYSSSCCVQYSTQFRHWQYFYYMIGNNM